jgi:pyrimidine-nucleoside phosphorylase
MNIQQVISNKRDKKELSKEEIEFFITEYVKGTVTDYQAAALVMAIYLNGMTKEETTNLTLAMANSGETLDLSVLNKTVVDKHSSGGVGDKITIVLMPIIASLGIPVAKMSGRGLGFTGGTIDKLESIPGYNTEIPVEKFIEIVKRTGISVIGQTANLAPADKKLYSLRDTIACVGSMPLIASSIMSKKIAAGAEKIVLDVTVGSGAFMRTKEDATKISKLMKEIGTLAGRETVCVLTNMDEPVGKAVGNTLEILETIECLKGNIPLDIKEIILGIGSQIIKLAGEGDNLEENKNRILENINNGKAYNKFLELISSQGGDTSYIENPEKFEKAKYIIPVVSDETGYISEIDARTVGEISVDLGAGRVRKEDSIDHAVGIIVERKIADKVERGEALAYIHANDEEKGKEAARKLKETYKIINQEVEPEKYILDII